MSSFDTAAGREVEGPSSVAPRGDCTLDPAVSESAIIVLESDTKTVARKKAGHTVWAFQFLHLTIVKWLKNRSEKKGENKKRGRARVSRHLIRRHAA